MSCGVFNPQHLWRQSLTESAMDLPDALSSGGPALEAAFIDPLLDGDMSLRFYLQVTFLCILAVVALQGALNVDRMGIVALDEVAVIAVHRSDQGRQRCQQAG